MSWSGLGWEGNEGHILLGGGAAPGFGWPSDVLGFVVLERPLRLSWVQRKINQIGTG